MDKKTRLEALKHLKIALDALGSFILLTQKDYSKQDADRALRAATDLRTFETFVEKTYSEPTLSNS